MPDCFISYSSHDAGLAEFVRGELERRGVSAFAASASLRPGEPWTPTILGNLQDSNWVLLLASRAACASAYVNQEIGAALAGSKHLVPVVWDMAPSELPGWAKEYHALDLRGSTTVNRLRQEVATVAQRIKQDKLKGLVIIGVVLFGLFALAGSD